MLQYQSPGKSATMRTKFLCYPALLKQRTMAGEKESIQAFAGIAKDAEHQAEMAEKLGSMVARFKL